MKIKYLIPIIGIILYAMEENPSFKGTRHEADFAITIMNMLMCIIVGLATILYLLIF